jgi:hypothetical protein
VREPPVPVAADRIGFDVSERPEECGTCQASGLSTAVFYLAPGARHHKPHGFLNPDFSEFAPRQNHY